MKRWKDIMDRIAVISDIHGNLESLKVVLSDIQKRKIKDIVCLGDIVGKGNHQHECIDLVSKTCSVVLKGNNDEILCMNEEDLEKIAGIAKERIFWCKSKLAEEDIEFIKEMPYCYEMDISGRLVRFFHATPEKIDGFIGNIDSVPKQYELFLPSEKTISQKQADVAVYGHIHMPYMQKMYNRTIVNTGSVGNAIDVFRNKEKDGDVRNTTVANYVIITGVLHSKDYNQELSFEFVNLPYNIEKELESNQENLEKEDYKLEIRRGRYRDMNKIYKSFALRGIDKNKI